MTELLATVSRPSRYLGCETNAVRKDHAGRLRFALAFPDLYEVGMSHLGLQILYDVLNSRDDIVCERVFCPWPDMAGVLRGRGLPLTTLESGRPVGEFDVLGFSLEYELSYSNVLEMLDLSGIPLEAAGRAQGDPIVLGGGPCCFNPEPVAPFFDAFLLGEGEEAVLEIADAVAAWRQAGGSRRELLAALAQIPGVYVPSFFEARYEAGGELAELIRLRPGYDAVERRVIADLDAVHVPERPLVPATQIIHDRLRLEIARGCTRGCRFCQAGVIYRPVRERTPARVLELAEKCLAASGFEEISLLSLSAGDYTCLAPLLRALIDRHYRQRVAVSLPSLRVGTLTPEVIDQVRRVRKTGFTLAPEAATDRLRRVINKDISEAELLETARTAYAAGWNIIKLYFMMGLPTEGEDDIAAIPRLVRQVGSAGRKGRGQVNAAVSLFVPKPHTPFQWERALSPEEGRARVEWLKANLTGRGVRLKWSNPEQTLLESVFARGDRRLADALLAAHQLGCRFDGWGDQLRADLWREAFTQAQLDPLGYLRERRLDEPLPWDHLRPGVSRDYILREREIAHSTAPEFTPDCRRAGCLGCGVCTDTLTPRLAADAGPVPEQAAAPVPAASRRVPAAQPQGRRVRVHYAKLEGARFLSHLELVRLMYRACRRAGVPVAYSQGFHPLPRLSFGKALSVGIESLAEYVDVELDPAASLSQYPAGRVARDLGAAMPPGLKVQGAEEHPPGRRMRAPTEEVYVVGADGLGLARDTAAEFLKGLSFEVEVEGRKGSRRVDLRPLVTRLEFVDDGSLKVALSLQSSAPQLRPDVIVRHVFGLNEEQAGRLTILKVA